MTGNARTMDGFEWSPTPPYSATEVGEDGWCLRDAVCQLLNWPPGSSNWSKFIESPRGSDTPRIAAHLNLACLTIPCDWNALIGLLDHSGLAIFDFHAYQKSHVVFVPDLRWLLHHWPTPDGKPTSPTERHLIRFGWPLGPEYMMRDPILGAVLLDQHQPPSSF